MKYSRPGTIDDLFQALQRTLKETLQQSGFGFFSIQSQRMTSYTRQLVVLCDSTHYSFAFTDADIALWEARLLKQSFQHRSTVTPQGHPEQVLRCLEQRLLRTWTETGCGHLEISCERSGRNTTRVIVRGAPSYCFHLSDTEIQRWIQADQAITQPIPAS